MTEIQVLAVTIRDVTAFFRFALLRIKIEHLRPVKRTLGQKWEMASPEYIRLSATIKIQAILFVFIYQEKLILPFTLD
jgi:hypothetical protein